MYVIYRNSLNMKIRQIKEESNGYIYYQPQRRPQGTDLFVQPALGFAPELSLGVFLIVEGVLDTSTKFTKRKMYGSQD